MAKRIAKYLLFFYIIYFLGHFLMSMAYRLGPAATDPLAIVLPFAVVFTLWKAVRASKEKAQILYGILSGFFMWCFFGEFLEYKGVIGIADVESLPLLVPYVVFVSFMVWLKYLPVGARFALGHFGCIWFLHFLLVNQAEVLRFEYPELFNVLIVVSGAAFLVTALFMFFKMVMARGEKAFVAYLLVSFTCFWATVETLQVMHLIPDYTYFSYWARKISNKDSEIYSNPLGVRSEEVIESFRAKYVWESEKVKGLAGYLLKKVPFPLSVNDLSERLDKCLKEENRKKVDEVMLCRSVEECISAKTHASFNSMIKKYVHAFKKGKPADIVHYDAETEKSMARLSEKLEKKIAAVKDKYDWEDSKTKDLAGYLLKKLPSPLLMRDFSGSLDKKMKEQDKKKVSEEMFCQAMEESMVTGIAATFNKVVKRYVREFKKEVSDKMIATKEVELS